MLIRGRLNRVRGFCYTKTSDDQIRLLRLFYSFKLNGLSFIINNDVKNKLM